MRITAPAAIIAACALLACSEKKEAHLERFLPAGQESAAAAPPALDPFALADDAQLADRVNELGFSAVAKLLGGFRYRAHIKFELRSQQSFASLDEEDELILANNGDFTIKVENDGGQGYRAVYTGGEFFVQNRFGRFHPRSTLAGEHLKLAEQAYSGWPAIYRLYRGRLNFTKVGLVRQGGREAVKFAISLGRQAPRLPAVAPRPEPPAGTKYVFPVDETPAAEEKWRERARPVRASGYLLADVSSGVVAAVDFNGALELERAGTGEKLELELQARLGLDNFGGPPSLSPPPADQIAPVPERIPVDTHPLDFYFGKGFTSGLGAPAGVAARPKEGEN